MRRDRYRAVQDYHPPEFARLLAEDRVGDFVRAWYHRQTFSGTLSALAGTPPTPTLLDLVVSAYLQGVNDTVYVATQRGMSFGDGAECDRPCCVIARCADVV